jgi:hypothetical protein
MENYSWIERYLKEEDSEGYVPFNHDRRLGQNQYASRYIKGVCGYPCLGEGLRFKNPSKWNYHSIMIHKDDLVEFHERVKSHYNS